MNVEKIREIIRKMTREEKIRMCSGTDNWHTLAIERLGIPALMMSDGPHGLRKQKEGQEESEPAVCYPTACAAAASFDRELVRKIGEALGSDCRKQGVDIILGPALNIKRSPLCGRNF